MPADASGMSDELLSRIEAMLPAMPADELEAVLCAVEAYGDARADEVAAELR